MGLRKTGLCMCLSPVLRPCLALELVLLLVVHAVALGVLRMWSAHLRRLLRSIGGGG